MSFRDLTPDLLASIAFHSLHFFGEKDYIKFAMSHKLSYRSPKLKVNDVLPLHKLFMSSIFLLWKKKN